MSNAGGARVTQTGLSLGTPQYMSPEQATGDRTIDARSDIYSLSAMTYEMLTGDPPHLGSTAQAIVAKPFKGSESLKQIGEFEQAGAVHPAARGHRLRPKPE